MTDITWKDVMTAFKIWSMCDPKCSCGHHYYRITKEDKSDEDVCPRERSWRVYYRMRDAYLAEPGFHFNHRKNNVGFAIRREMTKLH